MGELLRFIKPKKGRPRGTVSRPVREAAEHYKQLKAALDLRGWRGKRGGKDEIVDFIIEKMTEKGRPTPDRRSLLNYLNRSNRQQ